MSYGRDLEVYSIYKKDTRTVTTSVTYQLPTKCLPKGLICHSRSFRPISKLSRNTRTTCCDTKGLPSRVNLNSMTTPHEKLRDVVPMTQVSYSLSLIKEVVRDPLDEPRSNENLCDTTGRRALVSELLPTGHYGPPPPRAVLSRPPFVIYLGSPSDPRR